MQHFSAHFDTAFCLMQRYCVLDAFDVHFDAALLCITKLLDAVF